MYLKCLLRLMACITVSCILSTACSKKNDPSSGNSNTDPVIESIFPSAGRYNSILTIFGHNFSGKIQQDTVRINGIPAKINTPGTDTIFVYVPLNCGSGPVTITVNGKKAEGPVFTYYPGGAVSTFAGDGSLGGANSLNFPSAVTTDSVGNVYVAEPTRIKKITPAGVISLYAGNGGGWLDTASAFAKFGYIHGLAFDHHGNLFVADGNNSCIRKITPDGHVSTFAGNGLPGYSDGAGTAAKFWGPAGLTVDPQNNLYVTDVNNKRVRKITPDAVVTTYAGNGNFAYADGPASTASFYDPEAIVSDSQGNIYVAENTSHRVRKISTSGIVSTFAGSVYNSYHNDVGIKADFSNLTGIAIDQSGNIYVSDNSNVLIRKITPNAVVSTVAGTLATRGFLDGPTETAVFYDPGALTVDIKGDIFIVDRINYRLRKITMP